jgi:hypothetical protein
MAQSKTYECTSTYDPCYGMKIIHEGSKVQIVIYNFDDGLDIRIVESASEVYQGWGMRITDSELAQHFKLVA